MPDKHNVFTLESQEQSKPFYSESEYHELLARAEGKHNCHAACTGNCITDCLSECPKENHRNEYAIARRDANVWRMQAMAADMEMRGEEVTAPVRRPDSDKPLTLPRNRQGLWAALFELGYQMRRNTRSQAVEWQRDGGDWVAITDDKTAEIQESIAVNFVTEFRNQRSDKTEPLMFGSETWQRSLGAILSENRADPFVEWLESLAEWDGERRLNQWLSDAFEVRSDDDKVHDLAEWASRFILMGAVKRAYEPATKLDEMPVLIGKQGIGKSTAIKLLLPPEHREAWFGDSLDLSSHNKERAEALLGKVIVEISELTGMRKAEIESMKSFISRTDDGSVRLAYRRNPEPLPRRCIFVGTTNDRAALPNDPSGNRRLIALEVGKGPDVDRMRELIDDIREQLWAEAKARVEMFEQVWLPDSLKAVQAQNNEQHRYRDESIEDRLDGWLEGRDAFTTDECAIGIGLIKYGDVLSKSDQMRLANALRVSGYDRTRKQVDGRRANVWSA